jgi:hypothetical protein
MRALRTKPSFARSFGGWLALFALGLQLTLSFGHIHAEDFQANTFAAANAATAQGQPAPQNAPGDHNDGDHPDNDHDGCAICAVMHMAAASLVPMPPSVGLPPAATFVTLITPDRTALPPSARQPFQARAPPQA